jgi:hypothetical protein
MEKLKGIFSIRWVLWTVMILSLSFNVRLLSAEKEASGIAYFRYDYYNGAYLSINGHEYVDEKSTAAVLKNIAKGAPYIHAMEEKDIPAILNFFETNGWEVVSHAMFSVFQEKGVPSVHYSFVLRKK